MAITFPSLGVPGISVGSQVSFDTIWLNGAGKYKPGGGLINVSKTRDPGNADGAGIVRTGLLMAYYPTAKAYGAFTMGVTTAAIAGNGTTLTVPATTVTELQRRIGGSGTFVLTGPPVASGTVRQLTATYSAASGTSVTVTALGVSDVWTLTAPAGQDAGMYQLEVTTGAGTASESVQVTAALAANANSSTVDAALEALTNVGASGVAAVYSDPTLTLTFASNLGPVHVRVLADTTNDGGVFEGGWAAVHTTTGVDGRFIAGSFISEANYATPYSLINIPPDPSNMTQLTTTYSDWAEIPMEGAINVSSILDYPSDASLKTWLKQNLSTLAGNKFEFSDSI